MLICYEKDIKQMRKILFFTAILFIAFQNTDIKAYYIKINSAVGRTMLMLPSPVLQNGIDISSLASGIYYLQLTDDKTKNVITKKFIKN